MIILLYVLLFILMSTTWRSKYHVYTKTLCSCGFLFTGILTCYKHMNLLMILLPALIAFVVGDILITQEGKFKYALYAFLIGDIAFLFFYYHFHSFILLELIIPIIIMILLEIIVYYKLINIEEYKTEITSYTFALTWVTTKSILTAMSLNTLMFKVMAIGFILYFISDSLLLVMKFSTKKNKFLGIFNILMYYMGLFLIVYSFSFL